MPLSLTDPEVERLTEELARRHCISNTEVILQIILTPTAKDHIMILSTSALTGKMT